MDKIGVTDIDRKSLILETSGVLGTGVIMACFQAFGTTPSLILKLTSLDITCGLLGCFASNLHRQPSLSAVVHTGHHRLRQTSWTTGPLHHTVERNSSRVPWLDSSHFSPESDNFTSTVDKRLSVWRSPVLYLLYCMAEKWLSWHSYFALAERQNSLSGHWFCSFIHSFIRGGG